MRDAGSPAFAIHGGAGASRKLSYNAQRDHLRGVVEQGRDMLLRGASAMDLVSSLACDLEDSGLYIAGRGASPNSIGEYELDACIIDGRTGRTGAVTCLRDFKNPIAVARLVMERTPHALLAASGAEFFAAAEGATPTPIAPWYTHAGQGEANYAPGSGTVGCVARDIHGALASATSTAGVFDKTPGRIGDTPIAGAGTWADNRVAVSCSGQGELFMQIAATARLAFQVESGVDLQSAAQSILEKIAALGGYGGLIAVSAEGAIAMPHCTEGFKRAALLANGEIIVQIFDDD